MNALCWLAFVLGVIDILVSLMVSFIELPPSLPSSEDEDDALPFGPTPSNLD